jgi:hypothetical protein
MQYPIDKYKTEARKTFQTSPLIENFSKWTNSWQIGNVFDTLTDYLVRFPDAEKTPGTVVRIALDRWTNAAGSLCWYDDYGWWGIASEKAFHSEYANIFTDNATTFQGIARECWDIMHNGKPSKPYNYRGGPNVWDNRENGSPTDYFTSPQTWAVPRFAGGVWQYDMWKGGRPKDKECTPNKDANDDAISDPSKVELGPFQLTVMNGLYLVLALRLGQNGAGTSEAVRNEIGFLKTWFDLDQDPSHPGEDGLLMRFPPALLTLVRERVGTYAYCEANRSYPRVESYAPQTAWCGDQGLILGGLLDYFLVDSSAPYPQQHAISIVGGVLQHMVTDQVVQPTLNLYNDPDDYGCGSGVFWRYLLRGFRENAALRQQVLTWVNEDAENNAIYRSAEYACTNGGPGNALFADFNVLATLTAAIEILGSAQK